jgi:hypothetical protein
VGAVVISGEGINDRGGIAGTAFDQITGDAPAFLAIPLAESPVVPLSGNSIPKATLPENIRTLLRHRIRFGRSGAR